VHTKDTQLGQGFSEERAESRTTSKYKPAGPLKTLSSDSVSARNEPKGGLPRDRRGFSSDRVSARNSRAGTADRDAVDSVLARNDPKAPFASSLTEISRPGARNSRTDTGRDRSDIERSACRDRRGVTVAQSPRSKTDYPSYPAAEGVDGFVGHQSFECGFGFVFGNLADAERRLEEGPNGAVGTFDDFDAS
jgi:hypothetical protein